MSTSKRTFTSNPKEQAARRRLERTARVMDSAFRVPGTNIRFGADAVLGLIPVAGDFTGGLVSVYILFEAVRIGVSIPVFLRMIFNVTLELTVGSIPLLGDVFDVAWKANMRNVGLLEDFLDDPDRTRASSRTLILTLAVILLVFVIALIALAILLLGWIGDALNALAAGVSGS